MWEVRFGRSVRIKNQNLQLLERICGRKNQNGWTTSSVEVHRGALGWSVGGWIVSLRWAEVDLRLFQDLHKKVRHSESINVVKAFKTYLRLLRMMKANLMFVMKWVAVVCCPVGTGGRTSFIIKVYSEGLGMLITNDGNICYFPQKRSGLRDQWDCRMMIIKPRDTSFVTFIVNTVTPLGLMEKLKNQRTWSACSLNTPHRKSQI